MADRPTHTCIPGNRRLSVPADKTGSRAPYTPHRGPTYVRTYVRDATTHGVYTAWRGVAWRCRGMRGGSRLCMLAASVATRRTFPALRCDVTIHICRPRGTRVPSLHLAPPLSSCTTRELISDFASIFFLLSFYFCYLRVVKCQEKMIEDDREGVFFCAGMGRVDKLISSNKVYIDRFFRGC